MVITGSNGLPVFSTPEADHQQLAHRRHDNLLGLKATSLLQARDKRDDGGIITHRRQRRHVERRTQRGIADLGDTRDPKQVRGIDVAIADMRAFSNEVIKQLDKIEVRRARVA
jgi:hypothetical protein